MDGSAVTQLRLRLLQRRAIALRQRGMLRLDGGGLFHQRCRLLAAPLPQLAFGQRELRFGDLRAFGLKLLFLPSEFLC